MQARWSWRGAVAVVAGAVLGAAVAVVLPGVAGADLGLPIAPSWITTTGRTERVRAMARLGNTVYVGGEFTAIAPAPNTPTIPQSYLFAIDATTGVYKPEFAPVITSLPSDELDPNGVLALEADPATNTLFVGGRFTSVEQRAAHDVRPARRHHGRAQSGAVQRDGTGGSKAVVNAIYRVGTQLYVGGEFDHLGTTARARRGPPDLAAPGFPVDGWEAPVQGGMVHVFAVDPSAAAARLRRRPVHLGRPGEQPARARIWPPSTPRPATPSSTGSRSPTVATSPAGCSASTPSTAASTQGIAGGGGQFNVYNGVPGATKLLIKQTRANGNVQAVKVLGNTVFFGGHYDYLTSPSYPIGKLNAYRLDTLVPDTTLKVRLSGVWGVFAIMGTSADDLWAGGEIVSANATDTTASINVGNLVHLRAGEVADTQPPSAPGRPVVTNGVFTSLRLRWTPSADDRVVSCLRDLRRRQSRRRGLRAIDLGDDDRPGRLQDLRHHGACPGRRP